MILTPTNIQSFKRNGFYLASSTLSIRERDDLQSRLDKHVSDSRPVTNLPVLKQKHQVGSDAYLVTPKLLNTVQPFLSCVKSLAHEINIDLIYHSSLIQSIRSFDNLPKGIPWHQDVGSNIDFGQVLNFIYYPQATSVRNGVFKCVPICSQPYKLSNGDGFESFPNELEVPAKEGSIMISDGRLIHSVSPNRSQSRRLSLVVRYVMRSVSKLIDLNIGVYRNGCFNYESQREQ